MGAVVLTPTEYERAPYTAVQTTILAIVDGVFTANARCLGMRPRHCGVCRSARTTRLTLSSTSAGVRSWETRCGWPRACHYGDPNLELTGAIEHPWDGKT